MGVGMLYCLNCKKFINPTNKKCKCTISSLISITENMLSIANILDGLGLQVASAFCLTNTHNHRSTVEAYVYFKCTYPEELLQDLPNTWYWTDYLTLEQQSDMLVLIA